jgi:hypothetical protein
MYSLEQVLLVFYAQKSFTNVGSCMQMKGGKGVKVAGAIAVLIFVLSVAGNAYLFMQYRTLSEDPQKQAQQEMRDLVASVSDLMVLPEGEDPTIATVADTEKLKDQAFFANAVIGDKVLLYTTAKKAILYRPGTNKIIEVAPINIGSAEAEGQANTDTQPSTDTTETDTTTP